MRAVFTMILAGIHKKKWQMGVFGIGVFLCSFFLLGVFILNFTLVSSFDAVYRGLEAPDMVVSIQETEAAKEELEKFLYRLLYVKDYRIGKCYLASNVKLPGRSMDFAFLAAAGDMEPEAGEVIVNNAIYGMNIGDEVEISVNGQSLILKMVSMVIDAVNSAPESRVPYFWINGEELAKLTEGFEKGSYLIEIKAAGMEWGMAEAGIVSESKQVKQKSTGGLAARFVSDYEKYFGYPFDGNITAYEDIRHSYLFRYEIFSKFILYLFAFLFAMILVMAVLLSQMSIHSERKKIGILKSMGFTGRHIYWIYIGQYLFIAMIMTGLGILASGMLFQTWLGGMFANINRKLYRIKDLWYYGMLVFGILQAVLYFTIRFSIGEIAKISPIDAISYFELPGVKGNKKSRNRVGDFWLPTPGFLQLSLALVKCMHRKLETAFLFVLTLGMALLYLISFYIIDGVGKAEAHLEDWGIVEMDIYISRKTNTDEMESGLLAALDEDAAVDFYYAGLSDNITYRLSGSSSSRSVMGEIYDKEIPEGLKYIFLEGRNPRSFQEVAVGINFAKENNLSLGDKIFVIRHGEETELEIVGIYPSFKQYGNSIRFLTEDIQDFFGNQAEGYYSIVLKEGEEVNVFAERMSAAFADFNFFPMKRSTTRSIYMLLPPMAVSMGLFALIYLLVLLCMKKIMVIECKGDLDIYRFIGFTRRKVEAVVRWRFGIPILVGTAAAIPLSVYAAPEALRPLAQQMGLSGIPVYPNGLLVAAALLGILICGLASTMHTAV